MKKPESLRRHLEACIPHLKRNPENLRLYIGDGVIACRQGAGLSFEWRYDLELLFTDVVDSPDTLVVPLLAWLSVNQYDLFSDPDKCNKAIAFVSEVIDHEKIDISFKLALSERVLVKNVPEGWRCEHLDEPALPDFGGEMDWQIFLKNELIAEGKTAT